MFTLNGPVDRSLQNLVESIVTLLTFCDKKSLTKLDQVECYALHELDEPTCRLVREVISALKKEIILTEIRLEELRSTHSHKDPQ